MRSHRIAVYPGDGIGIEVIAQALRVLDRVAQQHGFKADIVQFDWGYSYYQRHSSVVPDDYLEILREFDAILLGAVGWPTELPDHVTLAPLVTIRQQFDQYACLRPVRLPPGVPCPLAGKSAADIDFVVIRENSEGEYVDLGSRMHRGRADEFALQTAVHTRRGIERILRFGFAMAGERRGRLALVTKSNAMRYAYVLWDEIFAELQSEYPQIECDRQHADACAMNFVRRPEMFDVVVASNLFGDLLTDLGGAISGGLGLAPSSNTNPQRDFPSMFEPVHGSAPDIAGQGIANPVAVIQSAAMMLDWLGEQDAAGAIRSAVDRTLAAGQFTRDLGGQLDTAAATDAILAALQ